MPLPVACGCVSGCRACYLWCAPPCVRAKGVSVPGVTWNVLVCAARVSIQVQRGTREMSKVRHLGIRSHFCTRPPPRRSPEPHEPVHCLGSDFTLHRRDSRLASRHGAPMTTVRNWKMQWVASDWHVPREPVNLNAPLATLACGSTRCLALLVRVCGILYLGQSSYAVASMPPPIGTDMSRVASGDWYVCVGR